MTGEPLNPGAGAVLLTLAFMLAGACQAVWLASPRSRRFDWPLDGAQTVRGRRLFGANKTVRGFVVMVPATGAAFVVVGQWLSLSGHQAWAFGPGELFVLGLVAGTGFMAGELPNSFLKRQLDIDPGSPARGTVMGPVFFVLDRLDSLVGMLAAMALMVPVDAVTIVWVLTIGPLLHALFSLLTFRLGGKSRAA